MAEGVTTIIDTHYAIKGLENIRFDKADRRPVNKIIKKELATARKEVLKDAKRVVRRDPRKALSGLRYVMYKRVFGGKIDIFEPKNKTYTASWNPERKLKPHQVGGNRRKQSSTTRKKNEYWGASRAFVLRFFNAGAHQNRRGKMPGEGWFGNAAKTAAQKASERIGIEMRKYVIEKYNKQV